MLTSIAIVRERKDSQAAVYRAIQGRRQASGSTPGQALDTLEQQLAAESGHEGETTLVIVQRFQPDTFFTAEQHLRLQILMSQLNEGRLHGQTLSATEQAELEQLIEAEWHAANQRAQAFLQKATRPDPPLQS